MESSCRGLYPGPTNLCGPENKSAIVVCHLEF